MESVWPPYEGLSPRVRGNLLVVFAVSSCERSIPASAGEPNSRNRESGMCTVYPRECGGTPDMLR